MDNSMRLLRPRPPPFPPPPSWRGRCAGVRRRVFGRSYWRGPRDRAAIALTFDDGPSESTPQMLEILARHRRRRLHSFNAARMSRVCPQSPATIHDAGHEIGNHSYTHRLLSFRSPAFIDRRTAARAGNDRQAHRCRAASGSARPSASAGSDSAARSGALGLTGVMWTVIGYDWSRKADAVVERRCGARCKRRDHLPSRWTRTSREARYRRDRGSRPAPGSHAVWTGDTNSKR